MYAQNAEDDLITTFFRGHVGRLIDVGAYDGKFLSNSLRLIELGWSAVCIEPSPGACKTLIDQHRDNERVEIVNAAIAPVASEPKLMEWYDCPDAVSTLSTAHAELWTRDGGTKFRKIYIHTTTMSAVLDRFGYDFDAVLIDVERMNLEVLQQFPFDRMPATKLICVEHDQEVEKIEAMLAPLGFSRLTLNAENLILGRS